MDLKTLKIKIEGNLCYIQINRPEANNTINNLLIEEFHYVLSRYGDSITVIILEGLPDTFCFGADFQELYEKKKSGETSEPERLYELWSKLYTGPFITVSHVKGKVNAGGIGFVAASDIVIADETASFSLSELLFGIFPAAVLPFLINRIGLQKANYFTLMTQPLSVEKAAEYGLVDAWAKDSMPLLRKHTLRLKVLSKRGIEAYKKYRNNFTGLIFEKQNLAIEANKKMFSDPENLEAIFSFVETGTLPWTR